MALQFNKAASRLAASRHSPAPAVHLTCGRQSQRHCAVAPIVRGVGGGSLGHVLATPASRVHCSRCVATRAASIAPPETDKKDARVPVTVSCGPRGR